MMEIDEDALKAFEASKFNFVDDKKKPVDFNNLDDDAQYVLMDGTEVVQDQMKKHDVIDTINNEFGKELDV